MAKYCGKCGSKLDERTGFCPNCNRSQLQKQTMNQKFEIDRSSIPDIQKSTHNRETSKEGATSGGGWKKLLLALLAFILILGGSLATLFYFGLIEIPFLSAPKEVKEREDMDEDFPDFHKENVEAGQNNDNLRDEELDTDSSDEGIGSSSYPVDTITSAEPTPEPTVVPSASPEPTAVPTPDPIPKSNRQIFPDSGTRFLTEYDVAGLSDAELTIARNEIYARHGRIFSDPDLRSYFESQSWYSGTIEPANFAESMLSDIEKSNVQFIKNHEGGSKSDVSSTNGQVFPNSSSRILTASDIRGKSKWELEIGRNEIYARHGRMFNSADLKDYFNAQSWYRGTIKPEDFSEDMLNEIEKANIEFIKSYE